MSESKQKSHQELGWNGVPEDVFKFMESRTASNMAAFLLPTLREMHKRNPNLKMLDVGAGSGSMTAEFAQIISPDGYVTGVDINPVVLSRSSVVAERWGIPRKNISFQTADGYQLPFEDGTFDVVHCHQVLVHNKNPWEILTEMLRVTKTGGVCAAREGDLETVVMWPPLAGLLKFHNDLELKLIIGAGGSSTAGRELLSWALKTGVKRSHITTSFSTWSYTEPDDRKLWALGIVDAALGPASRERVIASGISAEEMDEMRAAWLEWVTREDAVLAQLNGEVIIWKQ
ncbi:S-adenosyl-L-methionine-dependent methyltransferase [Xylariaceae sp. FL1272]|nr:S-adenosyl-L-methionine-dependent methyltransferase [Xylariaceae sp. FL1272]